MGFQGLAGWFMYCWAPLAQTSHIQCVLFVVCIYMVYTFNVATLHKAVCSLLVYRLNLLHIFVMSRVVLSRVRFEWGLTLIIGWSTWTQQAD